MAAKEVAREATRDRDRIKYRDRDRDTTTALHATVARMVVLKEEDEKKTERTCARAWEREREMQEVLEGIEGGVKVLDEQILAGIVVGVGAEMAMHHERLQMLAEAEARENLLQHEMGALQQMSVAQQMQDGMRAALSTWMLALFIHARCVAVCCSVL